MNISPWPFWKAAEGSGNMSKLREKLKEFHNKNNWEEVDRKGFADSILSLFDSSPVEGLEVVRKCNPAYEFEKHPVNCPFGCHGTGELVRPMTRRGMEELFLKLFRHSSGVFARTMEGAIDLKEIILPSGERVRVKK